MQTVQCSLWQYKEVRCNGVEKSAILPAQPLSQHSPLSETHLESLRVRLPLRPQLRIAQVAPLYESVPPRLYGGTERVVHWLTEELMRRGHDVTLFATADSRTSAHLVSSCMRGLRLEGYVRDSVMLHLVHLNQAFACAPEFDVIHSHVDPLSLVFAQYSRMPAVLTLHGRLDLPDLPSLLRSFNSVALVSISQAQRQSLAWANWVATVYHGIPVEQYPFSARRGDYLAFLGRITPEKRPDWAIDIARKAGVPLKIAAKVDPTDRCFFEQVVRPKLREPGVEFIGEIGDGEKGDFLAGALALLLPIDWPEPFGLVMIEAMACGTPVLARPCGAAAEIVQDGVTGYLRWSLEELAAMVPALEGIDRHACRRHVAKHFHVRRMADNYERVYQLLRAPVDALKQVP